MKPIVLALVLLATTARAEPEVRWYGWQIVLADAAVISTALAMKTPGSALECGACLDVAALEQIIEAERLHKGKELLERVVSMLTKMIR